ncbi:MAG: hypothetical protein ABIR66_13280, partial [Saprospiraceae bacterium]
MFRSYLFVFTLFFSVFSCKRASTSSPVGLKDTVGDSLYVTTKWCSSCHLFPDPALLTKSAWENKVLPNMGYRLGIQTIGYTPLEAFDMMEQNLILETNIYPGHSLISNNDWAKINSYILNHAPDSFYILKDQNELLKEFDVVTKGSLVQIPAVTLMTYDSTAKLFHIGLEQGNLFTYDQRWTRKDSINIHSTPVDYVVSGGKDYLLSIGKMYPSEYKIGSLFEIKTGIPQKMVSALHRPVSMAFTDMNGDQISDVVISEFGFESGALAWFQVQDWGIDTLKH